MRHLLRYALLVNSVLFTLLLHGQQPLYRFEQLPTQIGLTHGIINCFLQDHKGFLWFGTWSGLGRYDGYEVKIFRPESGNSNGLLSDQITSIVEDQNHQLWIGTINSGFYRFDRAKEKFINFRHDAEHLNSLSNNDVWSLFADSKGYIWIGTEKGLNRFDPRTNTFMNILVPDPVEEGYTSDYIYSICETPDGSIWSTTNRGLNRIKFKTKDQFYLEHYRLNTPLPNGFSLDDFIYKVRPSKKFKNTIWLGTKAGLKKVTYDIKDFKSLQIESYHADPSDPEGLSHNVISDIWEEDNGNVWIATFNGLNLFNPVTKKFRRFVSQPHEAYSLSNNWVYELYQDHSGILWIGTGKGINKLNLRNKPFHTIRLEGGARSTNSTVTSFCKGNQYDQIWVGTNGGLNKLHFDGHHNEIQHYTLVSKQLSDFANFTTGVSLDSDGWIWISTQGAGVLRVREKDIPAQGGKLTDLEQFTKGQLNDDYVIYLHDADPNRIWFGLWDGGIDLYNKKTGIIHHFQTADEISLTAFPNVSILESREGDKVILWVGTRGNGVMKLSYDVYKNKLHLDKHYKYKAGQRGTLSNDKINNLFLDSQQRLWVATGEGLNVLDPQTNVFQTFTQYDGLPDNTIQTVLEDAQGNIWISTTSGIASMKWQNGKLQIRNYDVLDGLQDNFFNNNCGMRLPSGLLSFGGVEGLNIFAPEQIRMDSTPPMTAISDFMLFNKSVPIGKMQNGRTILHNYITETDHIILNHRENVLSFEFASLHFAEPKKNKFAYKLEGFDPDWVYTDSEKRYAHYTNLPYRDFTFLVKSANSDGIWSAPVSLKVTVKPPFWLTWWAYLLYILLFITLLYAVWWVTHMRAAFRNRLALERVEREKLEEVNQIKLQFFTNISHELRTPLTLIISPLEQLVKEKSNDRSLLRVLFMMHQNAGKLLTMINQLLDFRKSEAGLMKIRAEKTNLTFFLRDIILSFKVFANEHHIDLIFNSNNEEIVAWIDRDQMEKALFNLLSNAFKFTPDGGKVEVNLSESLEKEQIIIRVADSGQGIAPEQLDKIFAPFHQGNTQPQQAIFAGTGIGLALVKTIMEQHKGKVKAESEPGNGAVFSLILRAGNEHFTPEEIAQHPAKSALAERFVLSDATEVAMNETTSEVNVPITKPHLLIVEDNADIRNYIKENLRADYDVTEAADGVEALEKARETPPDLILSDVTMPRMDGIEFCRHIKSDILTSHIPVVLLTARTSMVYKIDGLETGADDYITKPFSMQLLKVRIKNLIHIRETLREKFGKTFELSPSAVTVTSLDEAFLQRILDIVEQHLDDNDFSIDCLAKKMTMSRMQLYRKVKALTNETPNTLIRTIRLKRAAQLLATQQFNISEVAYKVGFSDLKYFRERFKEQFGVIPSEYEP